MRNPALLVLAVASPAFGQRTRSAVAEPILIRDVTVIDGTGASAQTHQDIVLRDGKVAAMVATGMAPAPVPDSIIDGRGLYVIPGLIDAHVHLGTASWDERAAQLKSGLLGGITTVLDVAGDARAVSDLQRAIVAGQIPGPHIHYLALFGGPAFFTDPRVLDASRGYAAGSAPWMQSVSDTTDFSQAVTLARGTGAGGIKLYAALDSSAATRATEAAHRQGLEVIAHATTFPGKPLDLVAAGVDMLVHTPYLVWQGSPRTSDFPARARGDFLGVPASSAAIERLLAAMRDRGTALNPTLLVFQTADGDSLGGVRTPWMNAVTGRAAQLGVRIVAGTDAFVDTRRDSLPLLHRELELLVTRAGLTPLQAITAATRNAAWAAGADRTTGTVAVGMDADLVLLTADPIADIRNTRAIRRVIQDGRIVR